MTKWLITTAALLLLSLALPLRAQELRATVRISTDALGSVERSRYEALEKQMLSLLNTTRWSKLRYAPNERIACSFVLNLLEVEDDQRHRAELSVTASRTAYGTNYTTTTFVYRDRDLSFDFSNGDRLEYNPQSAEHSLVSTLALYAILIIASDLDSYAPLAGDALKPAIESLISTASSQPEWQGWRALDSETNRASLAEALTSEQSQEARTAWYRYHRKGLDQCAKNIEQGRSDILQSLEAMTEWKKSHFRSPLLSMWETAKVEELAKLYELAPREDRDKAYPLLLELFPTRSDLLQKLKN